MRRALGQENPSLPSTQTAPLGATMRRQPSTPIVPLPNILIYRSYTADWPPHLASLAEARGRVLHKALEVSHETFDGYGRVRPPWYRAEDCDPHARCSSQSRLAVLTATHQHRAVTCNCSAISLTVATPRLSQGATTICKLAGIGRAMLHRTVPQGVAAVPVRRHPT
jgi:hypothetical protein